jgi:hypothetical protein
MSALGRAMRDRTTRATKPMMDEAKKLGYPVRVIINGEEYDW